MAVEITHIGDLPARSGMGSSSSFTVGLVNAIYRLVGGFEINKNLLAKEAIHLEQVILKERVGIQDQIAASYGGINHIQFGNTGLTVEPIQAPLKNIRELGNHLMLFFTGIHRFATEIVASYSQEEFEKGMKILSSFTSESILALEKGNYGTIGELLGLSWEIKKKLSPNSTNERIDAIFTRAQNAGSIGGKLLGAGGGGFLLLCVKPEDRASILKELS